MAARQTLGEHQVVAAFIQLPKQIAAKSGGDDKFDLGIPLQKAGKCMRQPGGREVFRQPQAHGAIQSRTRDRGERIIHQLQNALSVVVQGFALARQPHVARAPLEQGLTHDVFKTPDVLADRRLRQAHALRRRGEAAALNDRHKTAQQLGR
ncbi:hypothetical protein D3C73_993720 [compost metagenome]